MSSIPAGSTGAAVCGPSGVLGVCTRVTQPSQIRPSPTCARDGVVSGRADGGSGDGSLLQETATITATTVPIAMR